jgi:acyl carrier protein
VLVQSYRIEHRHIIDNGIAALQDSLSPTEKEDEMRSEIIEELSEITGIDPASLTPEATLDGLDIDSLDLVEFKQVVEDRYDMMLERDDFKEVVTIGQALDVVEMARTRRARV